jgi:hypothetical protein
MEMARTDAKARSSSRQIARCPRSLRPAQNREQTQQQYLVERKVTLPRRGSGKSLKCSRKTTLSPTAPSTPAAGSIASSANESEEHDRFSTSAICHELLHPITLEERCKKVAFYAIV